MSNTFALKKLRKNLSDLTKNGKQRLQMPMKNQIRECEWLWDAPLSCPEQALCIAVLQRAVLDLITPGVDCRDKADAFAWINGDLGSEYERDYVLSFSRIVECFTDMSAIEIRTKILNFIQGAQQSKDTANGFRFQRGYKQNSMPSMRMGERNKVD